jgi:hypothetical protein
MNTRLQRKKPFPRGGKLTRKVPMKRGGRLPPMSAKKRSIQPEYQRAVFDAKADQVKEFGFTYCVRCLRPVMPIPHHYGGRIGRRLLEFVLICQTPCHEWIHENPIAAKRDGWLIDSTNHKLP